MVRYTGAYSAVLAVIVTLAVLSGSGADVATVPGDIGAGILHGLFAGKVDPSMSHPRTNPLPGSCLALGCILLTASVLIDRQRRRDTS
ncbi:hypothetical protein [Ruegeria sp. MALMAid1280]|uniref:hypothetical protein n=1 Tax=Ruegeria sp. MALMAid1280 TaxID=3411634 RepID=UPI003BA005FC